MSHLFSHPPQLPLIFPSILASDFANLQSDCEDLLARGADGLHVDVMDGHFVPNLTLGPPLVKSLRQALPETYLDVHLMVTNPEIFVEPFAQAGADNITFHIEAVSGRKENNEYDLIPQIREAGCQVGICISPPTPAEAIFHLLDQVDLVLIMSVHPGFGGQAFMPEVLPKVKKLRDAAPDHVRVQMDGGVGEATVKDCLDAGMDTIVAGSALFGSDDRDRTMGILRKGE